MSLMPLFFLIIWLFCVQCHDLGFWFSRLIRYIIYIYVHVCIFLNLGFLVFGTNGILLSGNLVFWTNRIFIHLCDEIDFHEFIWLSFVYFWTCKVGLTTVYHCLDRIWSLMCFNFVLVSSVYDFLYCVVGFLISGLLGFLLNLCMCVLFKMLFLFLYHLCCFVCDFLRWC